MKQDGRRRLLDGLNDILEALLELALDARTGLQEAHIQGEYGYVPDGRGHILFGDFERQPFDERSFADPRFADQNRIVLTAPGEDIDHLPDLDIAAKHRVDLAIARLLRDVRGETREG
jgi:hypothetical protein